MVGEPEDRLRCSCGYRIDVELRKAGLRVATVACFDDEPGGENCGERGRECPGSDARLGLHALEPPK